MNLYQCFCPRVSHYDELRPDEEAGYLVLADTHGKAKSYAREYEEKEYGGHSFFTEWSAKKIADNIEEEGEGVTYDWVMYHGEVVTKKSITVLNLD